MDTREAFEKRYNCTQPYDEYDERAYYVWQAATEAARAEYMPVVEELADFKRSLDHWDAVDLAQMRSGPLSGAVKDMKRMYRALSALPGNSVKGVEEAPKLSFVEALKEAKAIVAQYPMYREYIDGTPLQNDIAVWMAEFAVKHSGGRDA